MVRSDYCWLSINQQYQLRQPLEVGDCEYDYGGYYIQDGDGASATHEAILSLMIGISCFTRLRHWR